MPERLVAAAFQSHTTKNNKDFDTGVYVDVRSNDQLTLLAQVAGGDANKEYKDQADNSLDLVVKSPGSTLADCAKFVFRVGMKPNGKDKWEFNGEVVLTFDNGKTLIESIGDQTLQAHNDLTWTGWAGGA